ncbi:MAG: Eco57I restriction-modification methylase domain-containing protein [Kosmotoga sp.]|uniref:Eco57I restriction-modification methylase domain-containing protein n=1 Tax=Kosmotoga sp. TaxID=1955248 RepID=UPI001D4C836B|nr:TaqI-like C-terminal specificity domain-containing protein [Kosmotoga sp.]MBO8166055.1 Eco57I restriction-modification methylase domain-containing protein [Kosmotoga sp.]
MPKYVKFNEPYNRSEFLEFLSREFLTDSFRSNIEEISLKSKGRIKKAFELGEDPVLGITVFEFEHDSEKDPRVSLSREAFRIMADYGTRDSLAIFKSSNSENYRFSYMSIELTKENGKIKNKYSNPKRYSFYLGPDAKIHTPEKFLSKRVIDLEDLRKRFSVEVVNKEFYEKIALLFTKLVGGKRKIGSEEVPFETILKLPSTDPKKDHEILQEFAVRLIGRIIFIWFLKEKHSESGNPLVPKEVLSSRSIKEAIENNQDYYHEVIEPLFFEVLNTKLEERKERFRKPEFDQIPFLNGGLFAPHNHDYYEIDEITGFSKYLNTLKVPNEWLKELLELLETYNFTIDENTPVDVELSVDPEMLGRIFENLLAEINPETGESARKATGSYYTPRQIVEYMVDESLKHYLVSNTGIKEKQAENLLSYADVELSLNEDEKEKILDALSKLKIIDPACGSGAFPMGLLQKIAYTLDKLDPNATEWKERQLRAVNPVFRNFIEEKFKNESASYIRKLGIIEHSIYGVDIQEIAVELSKLRVFLSLIVDANVNDNIHENRGVKPLPNLEFKFVCANTLGKLHESKDKKQQRLGDTSSDRDILKLKAIMERFFNSYGNEKERLKDEFRKLQKKIAQAIDKEIFENGNTKMIKSLGLELSQWDPFADKASDWFDPEWMFGIKNGFDIVIANPPYIRQEALDSELKEYLRKNYKTMTGTSDIYVAFYERGLELTREGGILVYISSNKFLRAKYGKALTNFLQQNYTVSKIIDFGDLPVFDATTYPCILTVKKIKPSKENHLRYLKVENLNYKSLREEIERKSINVVIRKDSDRWVLEDKASLKLLEKIQAAGIPLGEYVNGKIFRGIVTGYNKAFIIDEAKRQELIQKDPKSAEIIKPYLTGKEIKRYSIEWNGKYIILAKDGIDIPHDYPAIYEHLSQYKEALEKRWDKGKYWYNLRSCAYYSEFEKPKIVYQKFQVAPKFTFDEGSFYTNDAVWCIGLEDFYLLAFLNSKLGWFLITKYCTQIQNGYQLIWNYLENVPIVRPDEKARKEIEETTKVLINSKKGSLTANNKTTDELDKHIDRLIYQIHDLTPQEIELIDQLSWTR